MGFKPMGSRYDFIWVLYNSGNLSFHRETFPETSFERGTLQLSGGTNENKENNPNGRREMRNGVENDTI